MNEAGPELCLSRGFTWTERLGESHLEVVSGGGGALQGTGTLCLEAEITGAGRTGAVSENATSLL